ncbi:MAG: hypothetical protein CFE21_10965 [Bacteroidetes bacterium B1(2017)]|nr:MAG: hypothetical protein CFE21_10965 [Bacteroidetes bacterium B1(2017)]
MRYSIRLFYRLFFCLFLISMILSCEENNQQNPDLRPWYGAKTLQDQFKWFNNANNYFDSNYQDKFYSVYNNFLETGQEDSALYYLLVFSEMVDQNYINDSTYLKTSIDHVNKYESINNQQGELLKLYYYISSQYATIGINDSSESWSVRGLTKKEMPPRFIAKCHRNLSELYSSFSQHEKALPHTIAFLDYFIEKKDTLNIGVAYINLAGLYKELYAYETAENYMKKGLEISLLKNDTYTIAIYYEKIGNFYLESKHDSAKYIVYTDKLNNLLNSYSNNLVFLQSLSEEMQVNKFFITRQYDSIPYHLKKFGDLATQLEDSVSIKNHYMQKIRYEIQKSGTIANENEVLKIVSYAIANKDYPMTESCYLNLFNHYYKKGEYKKAIDYQKKIHALDEEIFSKNNRGQIYDKEVQYQTAKKDQEILIQDEKLQLKQRNIGLLLASLIIVALSFLVYFIWQKQKQISEKRKNETLFTQKLMDNTEDERMRIAKDLHDSVGHELLSIKNALSNKLQFTEDKIDHILAEVREISRNLFPVMFEEIGLKISVEQLAESIYTTDNLYVSYDINYIAGTLDTKSELHVYRIIQEALNNTRKYAQAKSAKISISQTNNFLTVEIKDNGKGFDVMEVLKSGKAFGLLAINQRSKALNAKASTESNSKGTTISLEIPLT